MRAKRPTYLLRLAWLDEQRKSLSALWSRRGKVPNPYDLDSEWLRALSRLRTAMNRPGHSLSNFASKKKLIETETAKRISSTADLPSN